jgi:hypothetical protein
MPEPVQRTGQGQQHAGGCFVRLGWMLIGNAILVLCTLSIAKRGGSFLSWADAVFWGTVAAVVWLRYMDICRLGGETVFGQPAGMDHWRRYALGLPAAALVAWSIAHAVAWAGAE